MSGGYWDYKNDQAARAIFGWNMDCDYGHDGFSQGKYARMNNPLGDRMISELVWDVFCLLHSYDWYIEGDTSKKAYMEDLKYFKNKWLNLTPNELIQREIDKTLVQARAELMCSLLDVEDE
jgi:hypothetical protein